MLLPVLLTVAVLTTSQPITADLQVIQYSPLTFLLSFSEPVALPAFQLLLNSYLILPVIFIPDPPPSPATSFLFTSSNSYSTIIENYSIQFLRPLGVGDGRLDLSSYLVEGKKAGVVAAYSDSLSVLIVAASYLLVYFTTLGHIVIEFLQIYCTFMYHDSQKTSIYEIISAGMLMLNPDQVRASGGGRMSDYAAMILPGSFILLAGALGYWLRRNFKGQMSLAQRIFYEVGVYNLFISTVVVFIFPLFFNSLQCFSLLREGAITSPTFRAVGGIASYFSLVLTFSLLYLLAFAINPKWGESQLSWQAYMASESFDNYRKLYEGLVLTSWAKRNKIIFTMIKRLLAAAFYFWSSGFEVVIFFLEFFTTYYAFTVRPYKAEIYLNSAVLCRLLVFFFYGSVVLGNLYFSLGDFTTNYTIVLNYLRTTLVVFFCIIIFMFLFIFYEIYLRCRDLNYRLRLVKEEDEYRLKFVEKERGDSEYHSKRRTNRSLEWSDGNRSHQKTREQAEIPPLNHKHSVEVHGQEAHVKLARKRSEPKRETDQKAVNYGRYSLERAGQSKYFSRKWKKDSMLQDILNA